MKFISNFGDDKEVSDEVFLARLRYWRDEELKKTDWTQLPDAPVNTVVWAEYRQALRDLPTTNANPRLIEIPARP